MLGELRVLILSHPADRAPISETLELLGAATTLAGSGREAVALILGAADPLAPAAANPFDLLLIEMTRSGTDALAATRALRQVHQVTELPIIALSRADLTPEARKTYLAEGLSDVLTGPLDPSRLSLAVLRTGRGRRAGMGDPPAPASDRPQPEVAGFDLPGAFENIGGDPATYARLARRFLDGIDEQRARLWHHLEVDPPKAAKLLHGLRGSALTLGATALADLARRAEAALNADAPGDARHWLQELDLQLDRVRRVLETFARGPRNPS